MGAAFLVFARCFFNNRKTSASNTAMRIVDKIDLCLGHKRSNDKRVQRLCYCRTPHFFWHLTDSQYFRKCSRSHSVNFLIGSSIRAQLHTSWFRCTNLHSSTTCYKVSVMVSAIQLAENRNSTIPISIILKDVPNLGVEQANLDCLAEPRGR